MAEICPKKNTKHSGVGTSKQTHQGKVYVPTCQIGGNGKEMGRE